MFFCKKNKQQDRELPDYKVIKIIGSGTFGLVKLIQRNSDKKYFALKQFSKKYLIQNDQVQNIQQEIEMMKSLDHLYIVKIEGVQQSSKHVNIIMEFIQGGELYNLITSIEPIKIKEVQLYAAQVLQAIEYLHSKDIVYRDLKPENLLINDKGHLKLTDFGLSKKIKGRSYTICGTPEYLAPEVILQKGHGKAVDFWCLGILIYEMITKEGPFTNDDPVQIYKNVLKNKVVYPKRIDSSAKSLLKKLLVQKVEKRLGCQKNGIDDIKKHRFFKNICWRNIQSGKITPEFVPKLKNEGDTKYFKCNQAQLIKSESVPIDKDPFIDFDFQIIFKNLIRLLYHFILVYLIFKMQFFIYYLYINFHQHLNYQNQIHLHLFLSISQSLHLLYYFILKHLFKNLFFFIDQHTICYLYLFQQLYNFLKYHSFQFYQNFKMLYFLFYFYSLLKMFHQQFIHFTNQVSQMLSIYLSINFNQQKINHYYLIHLLAYFQKGFF